MTIRAVFRVQCDGPGKEWLSLPVGYRLGTDIWPEMLVAAPTAERAANWPGERAARRAAFGAGWKYTGASAWNPEGQHATARGGTLLCPACAKNPLGIVLPPNRPVTRPLSAQCVCTHTLNWHAGPHQICHAVPGITGCGCLGFKEKEERE